MDFGKIFISFETEKNTGVVVDVPVLGLVLLTTQIRSKMLRYYECEMYQIKAKEMTGILVTSKKIFSIFMGLHCSP